MREAHACSLARPCLFHIPSDPTERADLAGDHPARVDTMRRRLDERWSAFRPQNQPRVILADGRKETATQRVARWRAGWCGAALANHGFMAPWRPLTDPTRRAYYKKAGSFDEPSLV